MQNYNLMMLLLYVKLSLILELNHAFACSLCIFSTILTQAEQNPSVYIDCVDIIVIHYSHTHLTN